MTLCGTAALAVPQCRKIVVSRCFECQVEHFSCAVSRQYRLPCGPCGLLFRFDGFGAFWCTWEEQQRFVVCNQDPCVFGCSGGKAKFAMDLDNVTNDTLSQALISRPKLWRNVLNAFINRMVSESYCSEGLLLVLPSVFFIPSFQYCPIVQF